MSQNLEASFTTLAMSIASSALMNLGLAPNPQSKKTESNLGMARFDIDLLDMLSEKTKGNLLKEEQDFMSRVLVDLKRQFLEVSERENRK